jgi:hypothetical protein
LPWLYCYIRKAIILRIFQLIEEASFKAAKITKTGYVIDVNKKEKHI